MIHILDTSASNSKSLYNALDHLNIKFEITKNIKELKNSTHIILPGVGSYKNLINHFFGYLCWNANFINSRI